MKCFILLFPVFQNFWMNHLIDNSMFKLVLTFIPGMLSLAYPLIIQSIGNLNTQYHSTHITNQFKKEKLHRIFLWNLRISVILTILGFTLSVKIFLIAFISVITLLLVFFLYLNLLLHYHTAQDLFQIYLKKIDLDCKGVQELNKSREAKDYTKLIASFIVKIFDAIKQFRITIRRKLIKYFIGRKKKKLLKYWHLIIDLYKYSIKNNNRRLEDDIRDLILYKAFSFIKNCDQPEKSEVEFPVEMYNSIYDILATYVKNADNDYYQDYDLLIAKVFYSESYDNFPNQYLHTNTLASIWRNLELLIEHNRNDRIKEYWKWAHQYYSYQLQLPQTEYDDKWHQTEESIISQKLVIKHQDLFIQLHLLLGAYLLHKKNLTTIKELWHFTQSQPPTYFLLPSSPEIIINYYLKYLNYEFDDKDLLPYSFRTLPFYGFVHDKDVRTVVCDYLVLLFMRLYLLHQYYYGMDPLVNLLEVPAEENVRSKWKNGLKSFLYKLRNFQSVEITLEALGLDKITSELCLDRKIKSPEDYILALIQKLNEETEANIKDSPLDSGMISILQNNSVNSITRVYRDLIRIKGADVIKDDRDLMSKHMETIRGSNVLLDREAFINDPTVHNINADSILGEIIATQYYRHFKYKLSQQKKKLKLKVRNGQLFNAISRLKPNPKDYSLINFGINLDYVRDYQGISISDPSGNEDARYNEIPIYNYSSIPHLGIRVYLIRNEFLPMLKHNDYKEIKELPEESRKYWESLSLLDENLKIYGKVNDLNVEPERKTFYLNQGKTEQELANKVEIIIDFIGYCWFKNTTEVIELSEGDMFQEGGEVDELEDISPL